MIGAASAILVIALAAAPAQGPAPDAQGPVQAAADVDTTRHLIFLAESRPIFLGLRVTSQGRPFEASWIASVQALHASLDRNGDGNLTTKEADPAVVTALIRLGAGAAVLPPLGELDTHPKDGKVSIDELAESLRPILGPFRLQFGRQAVSRTDALFDQLDRDKDGELTRPELAGIGGSLRPLDLDDNDMIGADELEPYGSAPASMLMNASSDRRAESTALPPVIELVAGASSFRPARLLLKKYDKGKDDVPGRPDNKLSPTEFAIDPDAFASADTNGDDALDVDELRKLLGRPPVDLSIDVTVSLDASGKASTRVEAGGALPKGAQVRRLADCDVEFAAKQVRLDIHIDDGTTASEAARRVIQQQFKAADVNKDGYLEGKEQAAINGPQSPLAGLSEVIDRDGDGKVYLKELIAFTDRQIESARSRLVMTTDDQGRAIFGIVDLDRDRRLGAREVMRTVDRVMSWDANGDGRVSPDEIPYHFQVTIARGGLPGLTGEGVITPAPRSMVATRDAGTAAGPDWFQKMDRNHDGDVSRREFLGPRDQFDRLDRDNDGLIDADEATAGGVAKSKPAAKDGSRR
jgi:Ca2+-binding EF-hand superfamily protein